MRENSNKLRAQYKIKSEENRKLIAEHKLDKLQQTNFMLRALKMQKEMQNAAFGMQGLNQDL